ncbi:syndecan isoform 5-T9 [Glossina fuscipes fuscipes]
MLPPYNKSSVTTTNRHQHRPYGISLFSSYIFNYFNNKWIWIAALLFGLLIVNVNAIDEKLSTDSRSPKSLQSSITSSATAAAEASQRNFLPRDEIYIDDEGLEGSGHGGAQDDLEKDHDFSGSGFGPDDEDSDDEYHHHHHTHIHQQTGKSNINNLNNKQQTGDNKFIITNSRNNNNNNLINQFNNNNNNNIIHQTNSGTTFIGSGNTASGSTGLIGATSHNNLAGGINNQGNSISSSGGNNIHDLDTNSINSLPPETTNNGKTAGNEVLIMNANNDDRTASFFAQPGILAAVIGGSVVGLLFAILIVMFIVYRMRKKDEGSYALDEPKRSPAVNSYAKNATNREFYA